MTSSNEILRTANFTLPAGVSEYAFFPGAWRNLSSTDIWLASGTIAAIVCDSEALASTGFVLDIHDYYDTTTYNLIRGGSILAAGCLTVVGPGTLYTGPALATPAATTSTSRGGFEVFATTKPAVFTASNKVFTIQPNLQTLQAYPARAQCLRGMTVLFTGGAVTTAEHKVTIIYEPLSLGSKRKQLYDQYRTSANSGALSFA